MLYLTNYIWIIVSQSAKYHKILMQTFLRMTINERSNYGLR